MADLNAVRQALADAMKAADITAYPRTPDQFNAPAAIVDIDDVDFRTAMQRGHEKWRFLIRYLCGASSNTGAEQERDRLFGGIKDVKAAIEAHNYGATAHDVFVAEARRFDAWQLAGVEYLGVEFLVEVYA